MNVDSEVDAALHYRSPSLQQKWLDSVAWLRVKSERGWIMDVRIDRKTQRTAEADDARR